MIAVTALIVAGFAMIGSLWALCVSGGRDDDDLANLTSRVDDLEDTTITVAHLALAMKWLENKP